MRARIRAPVVHLSGKCLSVSSFRFPLGVEQNTGKVATDSDNTSSTLGKEQNVPVEAGDVLRSTFLRSTCVFDVWIKVKIEYRV